MSYLKDVTPNEAMKVLDKIKENNKKRNAWIMGNTTKFGKRAQGTWTKNKTMRKVFSIPQEVYMANQPYWDEIIRTKQWKKHPEFMTEN